MINYTSKSVAPSKENVCAIIVSYHPDSKFRQRVQQVISQVSRIIIIDNGSDKNAKKMLHSLMFTCKQVEIIENESNQGVARALNQGAIKATEFGYEWALTLDQDTWVSPFMIDSLTDVYVNHFNAEKVKIIGSNYKDYNTGKLAYNLPQKAKSSEKAAVITSGTLINLSTYLEIGPFKEDFFIDYVDIEYCLRLRSRGYKVIISCRPLMIHSLGDKKPHRFLNKNIVSKNHSPLRKYYMTRNRLFIIKQYMLRETRWAFHDLKSALKDIVVIVLYEEHKYRKIRAIMLGLWHALSGKMGKLKSEL